METHLDGGRLPPAPGEPSPGALVPIQRRIVTWENGEPVVKSVAMVTPKLMADVGAAVLAEPYAEPDDELAIEMGLPPSEFYGRPLLEVMLIRQARHAARTGDREEVEAIRDRIQGKPKTTAENHNVTESYEDRLKRISSAEALERARAAVPIVTTIVEPAPPDHLADLL